MSTVAQAREAGNLATPRDVIVLAIEWRDGLYDYADGRLSKEELVRRYRALRGALHACRGQGRPA